MHASVLLVTIAAFLFFEHKSPALSRKIVSSIIFPVRPLRCSKSSLPWQISGASATLQNHTRRAQCPVVVNSASPVPRAKHCRFFLSKQHFPETLLVKGCFGLCLQTWFLWVWSMSPSAPRAFSTALYCSSWFLLGFLFHIWLK